MRVLCALSLSLSLSLSLTLALHIFFFSNLIFRIMSHKSAAAEYNLSRENEMIRSEKAENQKSDLLAKAES